MDTPEEVTMHEGVTLVSWGLCPSSCVGVYWALDSTSVCRSVAIGFIFFWLSFPSLQARTHNGIAVATNLQRILHNFQRLAATIGRQISASTAVAGSCTMQSHRTRAACYFYCLADAAFSAANALLVLRPSGCTPPLFVDFQQLNSRSCF